MLLSTKKVSREYGEASKDLCQAQAKLAQDKSPIHRDLWRTAKDRFEQWAETQGRMHQSLLDLSYQKYGNKSGKLLVHLCKGPHTSTHITAIKDPSGNLTSSLKDITSS